MREPEPGQRVRIRANHWSRARQKGTIREQTSNLRYLIEFDHRGTGFDNGKFLFLDERDFSVVENI